MIDDEQVLSIYIEVIIVSSAVLFIKKEGRSTSSLWSLHFLCVLREKREERREKREERREAREERRGKRREKREEKREEGRY